MNTNGQQQETAQTEAPPIIPSLEKDGKVVAMETAPKLSTKWSHEELWKFRALVSEADHLTQRASLAQQAFVRFEADLLARHQMRRGLDRADLETGAITRSEATTAP